MRWGDVIAGRHEPNAIPPRDDTNCARTSPPLAGWEGGKRERLWAPREGLEPKWPRMYPSQTGSDALLTSWTYARPPSVTSIISPQSSFGPGRIRKTPFSFPFDSRSLYACDGEMSSLGGMNQTPYPQTTHLPPSMHTLPGRTNRATPGRHAPDHQHLIQVMAVRERLLLPYL